MAAFPGQCEESEGVMIASTFILIVSVFMTSSGAVTFELSGKYLEKGGHPRSYRITGAVMIAIGAAGFYIAGGM